MKTDDPQVQAREIIKLYFYGLAVAVGATVAVAVTPGV